MDANVIPPSGVTLSQTTPPLMKTVTETVAKGVDTEEENVAAVVGGVICGVLLLLICVLAALLWLMSRQKGAYDTNEADGVEDGEEESDLVLQVKEPLTSREEEEEEEEEGEERKEEEEEEEKEEEEEEEED